MTISFIAKPPLRDGVVVVAKGTVAFTELDRSGWLSRAVAVAKGDAVTLAAPPPPLARVVVLDLPKHADAAALRRAGGALAVELSRLDGGSVSVALDLDGWAAAELAYGLRLRSYRPLRYRSRPDEDETPGPGEVVIAAADPVVAEDRFRALEQVAQGVFLARDLTAEPGNVLGPQEFADRARLLSAHGVDVEILDPEAEGLGLLAAVGQGSVRPPVLVVLRWWGAARDVKPLVLVGKGITFDSGGISIKPAEHMEEMKGDMAGAAAVLGALRAVAGRKAPVNVCCVLALAENMPSGSALRPGDVIRSCSGQTVEVLDTDAEGRLVLADALAWSCRNLEPALLVDAATLTGAVVRTLGRHRAGLYTSDDRLSARLTALGEAEDEPLWRLPLTEACDEDLKSDVADLKNCAWGKVPDSDDAARFLQRFVDPKVAWAHLDIAGVSEGEDDGPLGPKGPTGFGVRLFDALAGGGEGR